jgi:4-amino-4-deoxy-L-arabinose transferase-like glycosyltransferase
VQSLVTRITQTTTTPGPQALRQILIEPAALIVWLLSVVTCVVLALLFDPVMLTTDTAQHISVARNFAAGHGMVTDLLYFEQQQVFGSTPAPQTVWPPFFPLLTAGAAVFMDETRAVFCVAVLAHAFVAPLLYATVRKVGYSARAASASGLVYLAFGTSSMLVLGGLTESLFTLLTVCSLLTWVFAEARTGGERTRALIATGLFAALAYLTRYSGICLVAALGLIAGLRWLRAPSWRLFFDALKVALLPSVVVALMLVRNYVFTGSASGGPAVSFDLPVVDTLRTYYWSVAKLFGFDASSKVQPFVLPAVLALGGITIARLAVSLAAWRKRVPAPPDSADLPRQSALVLVTTYTVLSLLLITLLAVTRYPEFVNDRYLVPLWPCGVLVFLFALPPGTPWVGAKLRRMAGPAFALVTVLLLVGQGAVVARELSWYDGDQRIPSIRAALAEPLAAPVGDARTVGELLSQTANAESPLIETNGQYLGMLLRRPVVGMGETRFTKRVWDEAAVRSLGRQFNVRYLVFFPTLFDPSAIENRNRVFSAALHRGSVPPWLEPVHVSPRVQVYRIK